MGLAQLRWIDFSGSEKQEVSSRSIVRGPMAEEDKGVTDDVRSVRLNVRNVIS